MNWLVVDDSILNLEMTIEIIEALGENVTGASSGPEALGYLFGEPKHKPDIILMDYRMPGMDGADTIRAIRAKEAEESQNSGAESHFTILGMSGDSDDDTIASFKEAGADDILGKPIEMSCLMKYVETAADGKNDNDANNGGDSDSTSTISGVESENQIGFESELFIEKDGLKYLCTSKNLLRFLDDFAAVHKKKHKQIAGYLSNGDIRDFTIEVHSLKSAARSLGNGMLQKIAEELEELGDKEDEAKIKSLMPKFLQLYEKSAAEAKRIVDTHSINLMNSGQTVATKEEILDILEVLSDAVLTFDIDTADYCAKAIKAMQMPAQIKSDVDDLRVALIDVDFNEARELIDKIKVCLRDSGNKKMERILIADDSEMNREILATYFEDMYEIATAENGLQVIEDIKKHKETALLLLDLYMPEMNGFEVLTELRSMGVTEWLPVIIISGEKAVEVEERAFDLGATDFIHKPFDARLVKQRVRNSIELFSTRNSLAEMVEEQTKELVEKTKQLEETNRKIIDVLGTTVEFRHMDSFQHIQRVKAFTRALAQQVMMDHPEYELTQEKVDLIVDASSLHDIGKISIADDILLKPGRLTKEEFEEMKKHTTLGGLVLNRVRGIWDEEFGTYCYDICMFHHERYDGKGYPEGRVGEDIPLSAQIVSVVDVYDALVCKRCYKEAFPKDVAANMILNGECGQFSPKLLESFKNCRTYIEELADAIVG